MTKTTNIAHMNVLLVDDSSLMRQAIGDIVRDIEGLTIIGEAANGVEALEILETQSADLILLDIEMPVMGGLEFLQKARRYSDARIVVISSVAQLGSDEAIAALDLGAQDIVPKPSGVLSLDMKDTRRAALRAAIEECALGW